MKRIQFVLFHVFLLIPTGVFGDAVTVRDASGQTVEIHDPSRIVSIGGDVTEIIYALGAEENLIARDDTSTHPPSVMQLPSVGYMRTLSPEGVLAMNPSLVLATETSGPPTTIKHLRNTGAPLVLVCKGYTFESVKEKIKLIAQAVQKSTEGERLIEELSTQRKILYHSLQNIESSPKIISFMNVQRGALMAAGEETSADVMIRLAGGQNALSGFVGYKAISIEAAMKAQPDVILLPSHGASQMGGKEAIASMPELQNTPAVKHDQIIVMNSQYLLMFGPLYLQAAAELADQIHPEYSIPKELLTTKKKNASH